MAKLSSILCQIIKLILLAVFIVSTIAIIRALNIKPNVINKAECKTFDDDFINADAKVVERFQSVLRFRTVSRSAHDYNRTELLKLQTFIVSSKNIFCYF